MAGKYEEVSCKQMLLGIREIYKKRNELSNALKEFFICDDEIKKNLLISVDPPSDLFICRYFLAGENHFWELINDSGRYEFRYPTSLAKIDEDRREEFETKISELKGFCFNYLRNTTNLRDKEDPIYSHHYFRVWPLGVIIHVYGLCGSYECGYLPPGMYNDNEIFIIYKSEHLPKSKIEHMFNGLYTRVLNIGDTETMENMFRHLCLRMPYNGFGYNINELYGKAFVEAKSKNVEIVVPDTYDCNPNGGNKVFFEIEDKGTQLVLKNKDFTKK